MNVRAAGRIAAATLAIAGTAWVCTPVAAQSQAATNAQHKAQGKVRGIVACKRGAGATDELKSFHVYLSSAPVVQQGFLDAPGNPLTASSVSGCRGAHRAHMLARLPVEYQRHAYDHI